MFPLIYTKSLEGFDFVTPIINAPSFRWHEIAFNAIISIRDRASTSRADLSVMHLM